MKAPAMTLAGAILLLGSGIGLAQPQSAGQLSPADLVKAVISNELQRSENTEIRWKYLLLKEVDGKQETREAVETKAGTVDRLIAIAGRPLTHDQQREERERILRLSRDSEEQRKLEESRSKDAEQCNRFLQMIPAAFVFEYGEKSGGLIKVNFKPNPGFEPHSREGKVLHAMSGEIWVDARQRRLVSIRGQLMDEIKFAGGLLGRIEKGGEFLVRRSEISSGHWGVTEMAVNMRGKALVFKTISMQQRELHTNFQAVPDDLSLSDAAGLLLHQAVVAANY